MTAHTWQRVDDRTVKRSVYGAELVVCAVANHIKCSASPLVGLSLQTKLTPAAFRQNIKVAWKALRFQAPTIATKIVVAGDSFEFEYVSPSNAGQADDWVAETLLEVPSRDTSQDLVNSLVNDVKEREKYYPQYAGHSSGLYYAPGREEGQYHICLFSQHAAVDGRGSLIALDILLGQLPAPEIIKDWGEEIERLPLPLSFKLGLRKDGDIAPEGLNQIMQAMQKQEADNHPLCKLPNLAGTPLKTGVNTQYARIDLPEHVVTIIKKAAKARHIGFSYVVGAAIAMATYRNSSNREDAKGVFLIAVPSDQRFRLAADQRQKYVSNCLLVSGSVAIPVSMLVEIDSAAKNNGTLSPVYWKAAETIATQWETGKSSELAIALEDEAAHGFQHMFKTAPESVFKPTTYYSPLGVCDVHMKSSYGTGSQLVEASQPIVTSYAANGLSLCLHTWTWQGQFTAFINYSTHFYKSELVEKFLEDIHTFLALISVNDE